MPCFIYKPLPPLGVLKYFIHLSHKMLNNLTFTMTAFSYTEWENVRFWKFLSSCYGNQWNIIQSERGLSLETVNLYVYSLALPLTLDPISELYHSQKDNLGWSFHQAWRTLRRPWACPCWRSFGRIRRAGRASSRSATPLQPVLQRNFCTHQQGNMFTAIIRKSKQCGTKQNKKPKQRERL